MDPWLKQQQLEDRLAGRAARQTRCQYRFKSIVSVCYCMYNFVQVILTFRSRLDCYILLIKVHVCYAYETFS